MVNNEKGLNSAAVNNIAEMHNYADWFEKASEAYDSSNHTFAVDAFSKSIELNPDDVYAHFCRGLAYSKLGNHNKAIEDYSKAIKLYPYVAFLYFKRGIVYDKRGKYQRAIEDYGEAIRLEPNHADAYYNRALAHCKFEQYQLAIEDFNKFIRLKPDHAEAYGNRGRAYFILGKDHLGRRDAIKACALGDCVLLEWAKKYRKKKL